MASADLKWESTCPKCHKLFVRPKLLPCLHAACASCLSWREDAGVKVVSCPKCTEEFELPIAQGVSDLPTAFYKSNMVRLFTKMELLHNWEGRGCEQCAGTSSEEETVTSFCSECELFSCHACMDVHTTKTAHPTLPLEEYRDVMLSKITGTKTLNCDQHKEPLSIYCKTCKRLLCKRCTSGSEHPKTHMWDSVQAIVVGHRQVLHDDIEPIQETKSSVDAAISQVLADKDRLTRQGEGISESIEMSFSELFKRLEECKSALLSLVEEQVDRGISQYSKQTLRNEVKSNELGRLMQATEQCLQYTTEHEFMALKSHISTKLRKVAAEDDLSSSPEAKRKNVPVIELNCSDRIMNTCLTHMERQHAMSVSLTTATGSGLSTVEIGEDCRFTINTSAASGRPCIEPQNLSVKVYLTRLGKEVPSTVSPAAGVGKYSVCYKPEERGLYTISVQSEGNHISGSPFTVRVKPSKIGWTKPIKFFKEDFPCGIACSSSRELYITRSYQHTVAVLDKDGRLIKTVGLKGQQPGHLWSPTGIAVDREGCIYVADGDKHGRIQKLTRNGQLVSIYMGLVDPQGVLVNKRGDRVYVCDKGNHRVATFDMDLNLLSTFSELFHGSDEGYDYVTGSLVAPFSIAEDASGLLYITDMTGEVGCVQVFTAEGAYLNTIVLPSNDLFIPIPTGICVEGNRLYICERSRSQLYVVSITGTVLANNGCFGKKIGQFHTPLGIAIDMDGYLYVCDHANSRVQVF